MSLSIIPVFVYCLFSFYAHPLHVSTCEIIHNGKNRTLEITMKMFADDVESALNATCNGDFSVDEMINEPATKQRLGSYLNENFSVWLDHTEVDVQYLGAEIDVDVLWCFLEIYNVDQLRHVHISNTVMLDLYRDQVNLVHLESAGKIQSLQLRSDGESGDLIFE